MAELRLTFGTYVVASTLSVLALLLRTWYVHEELYTVVAVLTSQKVSLAILYNFGFMVFVGLGKIALHVLLGQLRDLEVEQVLDSGRGFLLDTVLFLVLSSPTLDGVDVSTYALAKFLLILIALKTAHLVVQIRGATMFEVGHPRAPALVRICLVLSALLSMDVFAVHFFFLNASRQSTFYLWLLFECLGMLASCAICIMKFGVHLVDLRLDNGWTSKSAVIFYLELMHDVTSLVIFLLFMAVFFITQPSRLPLYMTADIIHVVKALYKRILSLKKYRSLTRNLETRFPDATPEELEVADTCIICRDFLFDGSKKLPCSHIFHIDCLRSWLVQQQSCPTCRADIPTDDSPSSRDRSGSSSRSRRQPAAHQQRQRRGGSSSSHAQQQQQQHGGGGTSASTGSSAARRSGANARSAAAGREDNRRESTQGQGRTPATAAATSTSVETVARQTARTAAGNDVVNGQDSAQHQNKAHTDDVPDPLALLDLRIKKSSARLEAAAAAAFAAASSAAAAPSMRAAAQASRRQVDYTEELDTALRMRITQAEAVLTSVLTQALTMAYQMCDVYRVHASLWTIEAQRAQVEACQALLQSSELRHSCPSGVSAAEGTRGAFLTCVGAPGTATPAADTIPPDGTLTRRAAAPSPSDVSVPPITEPAKHCQGELATADGACGKGAAFEGTDNKLSVSSPTERVQDASRDIPSKTASSNDSAVGDAESKAKNQLLEQAATATATGAQPGIRASREDADAAVADQRRAEGGGAAGTELRHDSGMEYVVVCPSHLFNQGGIPYFSPYNEMSLVPFAPWADGYPVNYGIPVASSGGGSQAMVNDPNSAAAGISSSSNSASAAPSNATSMRLCDINEIYGNVAGVGQYSFSGPWTATPTVWQGGRDTPPAAFFPPPVAGHPPFSGVLPGFGQVTATPERLERATCSSPAGAVERCMMSVSESSADLKLRASAEESTHSSNSATGHVTTGIRNSAERDQKVDNHLGNSRHTAVPTDALIQGASAGKEEAAGSSSAGAETSDEVERAMVAELERLRKEQHRRWKQGGGSTSHSYRR